MGNTGKHISHFLDQSLLPGFKDNDDDVNDDNHIQSK